MQTNAIKDLYHKSVKGLIQYFRDRLSEVEGDMYRWSINECPSTTKHINEISMEANDLVEHRLRRKLHPECNDTVREHTFFLEEKLCDRLKTVYISPCLKELSEIENRIINEPGPPTQTSRNKTRYRRELSTSSNTLERLINTAVVVAGVTLLPIGLIGFTILKVKENRDSTRYQENPQLYMEDRTRQYIHELYSKDRVLKRLSKKILRNVYDAIESSFRLINRQIEGDISMLDGIIRGKINPQGMTEDSAKIHGLRRKLNHFYVDKVLRHEYTVDNIENWPAILHSRPLGGGGVRTVYKTHLAEKTQDGRKNSFPVAVKVVKDPLDINGDLPDNISIFKECEMLRYNGLI